MIKVTPKLVKDLLPSRTKDSNKGTYGKVLNIAGCYRYQGAAYFSSLSPLKVGAGLVTLASTKQVINNISSALPWVTFLPLESCDNEHISSKAFNLLKQDVDNYDVISIGPGLSTNDDVCEFVSEVINYFLNSDKKFVIDADALNIISKLKIKQLPQNTIITPHPMELSRLIDVPVCEIQNNREKFAKLAAKNFDCIVVLKGNETLIVTPDEQCWQNTTGNSALAKAGSGDVLTGMISGFMAQGLCPLDAGILSVYLHGLSGELASKNLTEYCVLASNQIDFIPKAINSVLQI